MVTISKWFRSLYIFTYYRINEAQRREDRVSDLLVSCKQKLLVGNTVNMISIWQRPGLVAVVVATIQWQNYCQSIPCGCYGAEGGLGGESCPSRSTIFSLPYCCIIWEGVLIVYSDTNAAQLQEGGQCCLTTSVFLNVCYGAL